MDPCFKLLGAEEEKPPKVSIVMGDPFSELE
jgi:hypothetical protein